MATIKLFGSLRKYGPSHEFVVHGADIRAVIDAFNEINHLLYEHLIQDGEIRPHFIITRNGQDIRLEEGLDTTVRDKDRIAIFSPIAGG